MPRVFGLSRIRILPIRQKENGVWMAMSIESVHGHFASLPWFADIALFVNHCDLMARIATTHAAWLGGPKQLTIAHHIIDFSLAKHFIDHHT